MTSSIDKMLMIIVLIDHGHCDSMMKALDWSVETLGHEQ